jgi:hypothetical protein
VDSNRERQYRLYRQIQSTTFIDPFSQSLVRISATQKFLHTLFFGYTTSSYFHHWFLHVFPFAAQRNATRFYGTARSFLYVPSLHFLNTSKVFYLWSLVRAGPFPFNHCTYNITAIFISITFIMLAITLIWGHWYMRGV